MFDLPVATKKQRRVASQFRKMLLDIGFSMVQLSVYTIYSPTIAGTRQVYSQVKGIIPPQGSVRLLKVTEKQYSAMINYYNDAAIDNEEVPEQLTLFDDF
jgi:CRISPR-associated protein Cas2